MRAKAAKAELGLGTTPLVIFATFRAPELVLRGWSCRNPVSASKPVHKLRLGSPGRPDTLERVSGRRWTRSSAALCFRIRRKEIGWRLESGHQRVNLVV